MNNNFLMDNKCFACGAENPVGLHLDIYEGSDGVYARINLNPVFQGYQRVIQGGIVATILDEMAVWASYKKGYKAVTTELNMRLKKPMFAQTEYIALAWIMKTKYKLVIAQAEIKDSRNEIIAWADVKLIKVD